MSRPLRVAIVAPSLAILGGQSVQADQLIQAWANDPDVEAWLVPVNPQPAAGTWLTALARKKYIRTVITQASYWPLLWRELQRADVVHVFSASYTSYLLSTTPALFVAARLGRPVLLNYHSGQAPDHLGRSRFARRTLADVDQVAVPSRFLADVFGEFGIETDVIPNIIDRTAFAFRPREPLRPRFLSTRNLEPLYNVSCTLRAFAHIQAEVPGATLTVVGYGSELASLQQLVSSLRLSGVTFTGRVPPGEMPRYYAEADIYLQSPNIDNMPLSVLEAFASGSAVVSTRTGGVPAILEDEVHGLLTPPGDDRAMASAALRLLGDPELAARLIRQACTATEIYTWQRIRPLWLSAYRRLATDVPHPLARLERA
jgi:glycosyltransferase involved in cell wall biosynthesis